MHKSKQTFSSTVLRCLFASLITLLVTNPALFAQEEESIATLRKMGDTFSGISEKASPAVVGIQAEKTSEQQGSQNPFFDSPFGNDFFEKFFRRNFPDQSPRQRRQTAKGSGFIISEDGYILTNNHLVGNADKVTVKRLDASEVKAEVIGTDPASDIALLKIDVDEKLPYLEFADSDKLKVGEWVLAIGNPFGLSHTVTAGIVSAKGRSGIGLADYEDFIQTDAAINPGNSGGPLINLQGEVVGINTAIVGSTGNVGIGLAIPVNMAKSIYKQLAESGEVKRAFLGVAFEEMNPKLAKAFGLDEDTKGVIVTEVVEDSAAEQAGLKHNDVIVEFNGKKIEDAQTFRNRVAMLKPGTEVTIGVIRDGEKMTFEVELKQRPDESGFTGQASEMMDKLGFSIQPLTGDIAKRFGYQDLEGVVVSNVKPGSAAEMGGIREGLLILEVNKEPVSNTEEFRKAVQESAESGRVLLLVTNGRARQFVILTIPTE
jgi:serine protease Do